MQEKELTETFHYVIKVIKDVIINIELLPERRKHYDF